MGKRILLDVAPNGVQHSVDVDENGFTYIEHAPTFIENEILDECSKLRGLHQTKGHAFKLAAKIPVVTHTMWKQEWRETYSKDWTWPTYLAMKLNSRENQNLRVGHKRSGSMKL